MSNVTWYLRNTARLSNLYFAQEYHHTCAEMATRASEVREFLDTQQPDDPASLPKDACVQEAENGGSRVEFDLSEEQGAIGQMLDVLRKRFGRKTQLEIVSSQNRRSQRAAFYVPPDNPEPTPINTKTRSLDIEAWFFAIPAIAGSVMLYVFRSATYELIKGLIPPSLLSSAWSKMSNTS